MNGGASFAELSGHEFLEALYAEAGAQGIPLSASIELTERCNLGCVHCYLGDQAALRSQRERELSTGQWLDVLDQIADCGCLRLLITGGEPLLRQDFAAVFEHAKRLGLLVTVFTNGTLVDDTTSELFHRLPPYAVEITLYGATAQTYEAITGVPGSFLRCMGGIKSLRALGVELGLKAILMGPNKHEIHLIADLARSLGTRRFRFDSEIQGAFGGDHSPLDVRLEPHEAVRFELACPETKTALQDYFHRRQGLEPSHPELLYGCGAGRSGIHVNPYGQLQPCLSVRNIGFDLLQGGLSDGLRVIRQQLEARTVPHASPCPQCADRTVCSACPAFSLQERGSEEQAAEYQCQLTKLRRQLVASG